MNEKRFCWFSLGKSTHLLDVANLIVIAWNEIKQETLFNFYRKTDMIPLFHINDVEVVEMENQRLDDHVALLCDYSLLQNTQCRRNSRGNHGMC